MASFTNRSMSGKGKISVEFVEFRDDPLPEIVPFIVVVVVVASAVVVGASVVVLEEVTLAELVKLLAFDVPLDVELDERSSVAELADVVEALVDGEEGTGSVLVNMIQNFPTTSVKITR